jgi:hypothetical protein
MIRWLQGGLLGWAVLCAGSVTASQDRTLHLQLSCSRAACASSDWGKLRIEWQEHMNEAAAQKGWVLVFHDAPPKASEPGRLVVVHVNEFRFVSPGARFTMGVFVGKASLNAKASFFQLPGRKPLGTTSYDTTSNAWQGIFSAMTTKQVAAISEDIVKQASR